MAPYVEYIVAVTFLDKPEPDDPRSLDEQADEQIEALGVFLEDIGAHLEVLKKIASSHAGAR